MTCYFGQIPISFKYFTAPGWKGGAGVSNDVFGIDGFACRMFFDDVCPVFVKGFGEVVNGVFVQAGSGDKMHGADVHACESFCLPSVGFRRNGCGKKEGVVLKETLFSWLFKGNKINVLGCTGLGDRGCGYCAP